LISSTGAARHGADGTLAVVRSPDPITGEMRGESMIEEVVVPAVTEVRCYVNSAGDMVLARPGQEWEGGGDIAIVIPRSHARLVIKRMQSLLKGRD
jgi:hypothetical protein